MTIDGGWTIFLNCIQKKYKINGIGKNNVLQDESTHRWYNNEPTPKEVWSVLASPISLRISSRALKY